MAEIRPFKGILYNREKVDNLSSVVAPPYDVISPEEQEKYYQRNPHNIVRLILGKDNPQDTPEHNKYTRAREYFEKWLDQGILQRDEAPAIYLYEQTHHLKMTGSKKRRGLIALMKLEDFQSGKILPHEETLAEPKTDRLNLLRACQANFCQIFGLYSDPEHLINNLLDEQTNSLPTIQIKDEEKVIHKIWRIIESEVIHQIIEIIKDKPIFIADGHHRYETALNYRNEMRSQMPKYTGEEPFNYTTIMLVNMDDQELTILPIHRVIKGLSQAEPEKIKESLSQFFEIEEFAFDPNNEMTQRKVLFEQMKTRGRDNHIFGMYLGNNKYYLLALRDYEAADKVMGANHSPNWKQLNVVILQSVLMEHILGLREGQLKENVDFIVNHDEAIDKVKTGKYQIAFFLNPIRIKEVKKIALNQEKMPEKSTFFYPKLLSGLVIWKME